MTKWIEEVAFRGRSLIITRYKRDCVTITAVPATPPEPPDAPLPGIELPLQPPMKLGDKLAENSEKTPSRARRRPGPPPAHRRK